MKKIIFLLLFSFSLLYGFELKHDNITHSITLDKLLSFPLIELKTVREKNGETKVDHWKGISLPYLLEKYEIIEFEQLIAKSEDGYLVRLQKSDISPKTILSLFQNGEMLTENKIRLVIPEMRDMFWIQEIALLETETAFSRELPTIIYAGFNLLEPLDIKENPSPFTNCQGYHLIEMFGDFFPTLSGDFYLQGKDGVNHTLDFETYLKQAVLIQEKDGLDLKSPAMPAGMWIKNIAFLQSDERIVSFYQEFLNEEDLIKKLELRKNPKQLLLFTTSGEMIEWQKDKEIQWKNILKMQLTY